MILVGAVEVTSQLGNAKGQGIGVNGGGDHGLSAADQRQRWRGGGGRHGGNGQGGGIGWGHCGFGFQRLPKAIRELTTVNDDFIGGGDRRLVVDHHRVRLFARGVEVGLQFVGEGAKGHGEAGRQVDIDRFVAADDGVETGLI